MPSVIKAWDIDPNTKIHELNRLLLSTSDPDRRSSLIAQIEELQTSSSDILASSTINPGRFLLRRKSLRPASAKPHTNLASLSEDTELHTSLHDPQLKNLEDLKWEIEGKGENIILCDRRKDSIPHSVSITNEVDPKSLYENRASDSYLELVALVNNVSSSSFDPNHPPSNILCSDPNLYWISTGMFPQFVSVIFKQPLNLSNVTIACRYVNSIDIGIQGTQLNMRKKMFIKCEKNNETQTHQVHLNSSMKTMFLQLYLNSWESKLSEGITRGNKSQPFAVIYHLNFKVHKFTGT